MQTIPDVTPAGITPAEMSPLEVARRLFELGEAFDEREVILAALDIEEVIRLGRQRVELRALKYAPEMVDVLVEEARAGKNVKAARTVLEIIGAIGGRSGGAQTAFVNQINISPQEIERLERELYGPSQSAQ